MDMRIPIVGEVLVHRFRLREGDIRAEVVSVDPETRSVRETSQNGWIYWGLEEQVARGRVGCYSAIQYR